MLQHLVDYLICYLIIFLMFHAFLALFYGSRSVYIKVVRFTSDRIVEIYVKLKVTLCVVTYILLCI